MPVPSSHNTASQRRHSQYSRISRLWLIVLTLLGFGVCAGIGIWWQDRPLREAAALLTKEDFEGSFSAVNRFLIKHPNDTRAELLKARALSCMNRHNEADRLFQTIAFKSNGFPDDDNALRAWSVSLLYLHQWPRAVSILETLLQNSPTDAELLYRLSVARIRLKQYAAALESTQQLAKVAGHEDQANVMMGTIHHDRGNGREALDAWEKVIANNPELKDLQISGGEFQAMVGYELLKLGELDRAIITLEKSASTHPTGSTYSLLGEAYSQTNRPADAKRAWQESLRLDPESATSREELANLALREGQPQDAVDLMRPLTGSSDFSSSSAYVLQRAFGRLNQTREADHWRQQADVLRKKEKRRSRISEMLRNSADSFWSGYLHAYQLADDQQWSNAEKIANDLLIKRPNDPLMQKLIQAIRQHGELPSLDEVTQGQ